jgi:putative hydrolase of the HAD superfamily
MDHKKKRKKMSVQHFDGIAFDLDGTLYPNYRFYVRLLPFIMRHPRLLITFGRARTLLRERARSGSGVSWGDNFYQIQAACIAELLKKDPAAQGERIEKLIYRGWEPLFRGLPLYAEARETLAAFQDAGLKLGMLSDFPPKTKLGFLGLAGFWQAILCSEAIGRLKPDPLPFQALARQMGAPPERILYVGNSVACDVVGAKAYGMKAALIRPRLSLKRNTGGADFVFSNYRQLRDFVLEK